MPIYTGRGDEGQTDLWNMDRVPKTDSRVEAYGTVDEVNSLLGTVLPTGYEDVDDQLETVQNHLFVVQADFANPDSTPGEDDGEGVTACIREEHVDEVETWIDAHQESLPELRDFVLPGGSEAGAKLHHVRTVCRRAERRAVGLAETEDGINRTALQYLNRLSDYLFVLARTVNHRDDVPEANPTY